jgi:hypothetical protein
MKPVHFPRSLIIFIFILVAVTFLAGTLHAFDSARATTLATSTVTAIDPTENDADVTPTLEPTPVPTPIPVSADTAGVIAIAIVIVVIVLVGAILGSSRPRKKKVP